jgi:hypothetical protein
MDEAQRTCLRYRGDMTGRLKTGCETGLAARIGQDWLPHKEGRAQRVRHDLIRLHLSEPLIIAPRKPHDQSPEASRGRVVGLSMHHSTAPHDDRRSLVSLVTFLPADDDRVYSRTLVTGTSTPASNYV